MATSKFIVRELKPMIDKRFNVRTDRANTVMMGSSMGSLVSLDAINHYPQVFGGAGMMSTHWPLFMTPDGKSVGDQEYEAVSSAFERYLAPALPDPRTHKLYFDHGSETLDAVYARYQRRVDAVVQRRGYRKIRKLDEPQLPRREAQRNQLGLPGRRAAAVPAAAGLTVQDTNGSGGGT